MMRNSDPGKGLKSKEMGGGDLNLKKSWHPSTYANLKKVWEAEQAQLREQQKLDQLRKEKQIERDKEELKHLKQTAGLMSESQERVEWMYSGAASKPSDSIAEEYLLGKRKFEPTLALDSAHTYPNNRSATTAKRTDTQTIPHSTRELENRLREDPVYIIKKREIEEAKKLADRRARAEKFRQYPRRTEDNTTRSRSKSPTTRRSRRQSPANGCNIHIEFTFYFYMQYFLLNMPPELDDSDFVCVPAKSCKSSHTNQDMPCDFDTAKALSLSLAQCRPQRLKLSLFNICDIISPSEAVMYINRLASDILIAASCTVDKQTSQILSKNAEDSEIPRELSIWLQSRNE